MNSEGVKAAKAKFDQAGIEDVSINTTMDTLNLKIKTTSPTVELTIKEKDKIVVHEIINNKEFTYKFDNPINWSPDNPFLYDLEIKTCQAMPSRSQV